MHLNVPVFIGFSGFCILVLGLLCSSIFFPKLETYLIDKATAFEKDSQTFNTWQKIPFPFKFKIYFFNVSNPDEVNDGAKPIFKEVGPYIYDEYRQRSVISYNEDNDTVKYTQRKFYYFNKEESGCHSEDDVVTIVHFAVVSMADKINSISSVILPLLNEGLPYLFPNIKNVFITNTVKNILFDGLKISCESEEVDMICDGLRSNPPHTIRSDSNKQNFLLSLFHHINNSDDGPYEMTRGLKNTIKGRIVTFKDDNALTQWNGDQCNEIKGTDLTLNPNYQEKPKSINFFVPDFCQYFSLNFYKEIDYMSLQAYYFNTANLIKNKKCFCKVKSDDDEKSTECPLRGTLDLTPCTKSAVVLSQPHFLNTENSSLIFNEGLDPDKNKHGTFVIIEPKTGVALKVKTRFQMNIFLKRYDDIDVLRNISEGLFPFIWFENSAEVPLNLVEEIKNNFDKLKVFEVFKYLMIVSGIILLASSLILAMIKDDFCSKKNTVAATNNNFKINTIGMSQFQENAWKITE